MDASRDAGEGLKRKLDHLRRELGEESLVEGVMGRVRETAPPRRLSTWRILMYDHWKKSTAAVAVVAVTVTVISLEYSTPSVYAIDRTLAAIDKMGQSIETVHFAAELYKQGNIECWMRFDRTSSEPTHMCILGAFGPVRKIDKPQGSFVYNKRTNRVRKMSRDERNKSWYLDFAWFFQEFPARGQGQSFDPDRPRERCGERQRNHHYPR